MKKEKIDYKGYVEHWKNFFESKRFQVVSFDMQDNEFYCRMSGYVNNSDEIRVDIYAGDFRDDTKTHGCIGIDFQKNYNKLSQCPIYFDLDEKSAWKAIELLVEKGSVKKIVKDKNEWKVIEW